MTACACGPHFLRSFISYCAVTAVATAASASVAEMTAQDTAGQHFEGLLVRLMVRIATALTVIVLLGKVIEWSAKEVARSLSEIADSLAETIVEVRSAVRKLRNRLKAPTTADRQDTG
jgi:hypothetical protein